MTTEKSAAPECPYCHSLHYRLFFLVRLGVVFYKCRKCKIVSRWPQLDNKILVDYYTKQYYNASHKLRFDERRIDVYRHDFLEATRGKQPGTVLDFGCGLGHFVELAKRIGWDAMGVELSPEAMEYARTQRNLTVIRGSFEEVALLDRQFDMITLWNVLDQMNNSVEALQTFHRKLKPGGLLLLRLLNLTPRYALFKLGSVLKIPFLLKTFSLFHDTVFTATTITALLQQNGYSQIKVKNSYLAGDMKGNHAGRNVLNLVWGISEIAKKVALNKIFLAPSLLVVARKSAGVN
jgi:2-polyprenyl-3-methyl-5-hydroxy-6-metoxy-1,4-benzoquinol methylase